MPSMRRLWRNQASRCDLSGRRTCERMKGRTRVSKATHQRALRILICDPDQEFVREVQQILNSEGHTVMAETSLIPLIRLASTKRPDVIILPGEYLDDSIAEFLAEFIDHLTPRPAVLLTCRTARFDLAWLACHKGADGRMFRPLLTGRELREAIARARNREAEHSADRSEA